MDGFITGFVSSIGWIMLLLPIYLVKSAFRVSID